jgi:hypothetical protein
MQDDLSSTPEDLSLADILPGDKVPSAACAKVIEKDESLEIARSAMARVTAHSAWFGPLLEALGTGATPGISFATNWGGAAANPPTPDPNKHDAYVAYIRDTLNACPWLLPLLDSAGATIVVGPGFFCYAVAGHPGVLFDVPELLPVTYLTPWADPDETAQ